MRKVLALTLGVLLIAGAALAQEPAEVPLFFAVGIPGGALPTIDGDGSDWAWVDRSFEVTIDDMNPLTGGADDADDGADVMSSLRSRTPWSFRPQPQPEPQAQPPPWHSSRPTVENHQNDPSRANLQSISHLAALSGKYHPENIRTT